MARLYWAKFLTGEKELEKSEKEVKKSLGLGLVEHAYKMQDNEELQDKIRW